VDKRKVLRDILSSAGITINGSNPWDVCVNDENIYERVFRDGDIGIGEGYMFSEWDSASIDELVKRVSVANIRERLYKNLSLKISGLFGSFKPHNPYEVAKKHYDLGNKLFSSMLDKRMVYTCGYWKNAADLDQAQEDKLDLVCRKIGLKRGMRVLDIGGGWGSFAKFAASNYGARVVNITVSKEQVALADKLCEGLEVENRLQDYREVKDGPFDAIVSLGMFEHVGSKYYPVFFETARRNLKDDGLFLLHTIGASEDEDNGPSWIIKYIFPNSEIPTLKRLTTALEGVFVVEDMHNFSADYDKTLMAWYKNFHDNWDKLKSEYGEVFYRMWKFYLLSCAGTFRARKLQLWQFILSKDGIPGGYVSIRG
jgi:cyclopropane-fatty-acyl-phospholipid synthase